MNEPDRPLDHLPDPLLDHELALIREIVTEDVAESLRRGSGDPALRERLAQYEERARAMALEPQTLQVILSGRRVLRDDGRTRPGAGGGPGGGLGGGPGEGASAEKPS